MNGQKPPVAGLRERKRVRTRQELLASFLALLDTLPLDRISVEALCERAGYSRATFFGYFGSKEAILDYFVQGWCFARSVELAAGEVAGMQGIHRLFDSASDRPHAIRLICGLVHYYSGLSGPPPAQVLEPTEKLALHPGAGRYPQLRTRSLAELFDACLEQAGLSLDSTVLVSIFYGVPLQLYLQSAEPTALAPAYRSALGPLLGQAPASARGGFNPTSSGTCSGPR